MGRNDFLTEAERTYLNDPEGFADDRADSTVRNVQRNIREKYSNAIEDYQLMHQTPELWDSINVEFEDMDWTCYRCGREDTGDIKLGAFSSQLFPLDGWGYYASDSSMANAEHGFCPDCNDQVHDEALEMAEEKDRAPCYLGHCSSDTHQLGTEAFEECSQKSGIALSEEDIKGLST